ncbi:DUF3613 domain-containing protein [Pigmentiphaga sp.]|uniref:DUF3613 domain-containing protein n=1 Tax=Pigmentiphaga sp. TaxID=1977564 RepID=UPI0025FD7C33|nr:DUF3613 domain-containing protein [Pigmentiphaga sp.]
MKRTSQSLHGQFSPRRVTYSLMLAVMTAAPVAHGQSNAPVTGSMMQVTPEQRARMQEAARQAQAEEQARQAAAARQQAAQRQAAGAGAAQAPAARGRASSVVRQVPGPAAAPAPRPASGAQPSAAVPQAGAATQASATQEALAGKNRPTGDVTRAVLRAQAEGRLAGQALPMLGATAAPSWKRYVESFSHPIPEFYETTSQPKQ